jgi:MFS transporter, Spinster family, sphingosine-1-phosphate transporter
MALGLVLQDIKADLALSDTQLGILTGIAFALFYSVMGIPIARWADRGNRVTIVTITTALWSVAVALCAIAGSFAQLLAIRVGVAVGEAGCIPPAHSLIADHFTRAERPRAVARYMLGAPLSMVIGYFLAGWLNELYGWRTTFLILGLPGVALAAIAWLTLKEPRVSTPVVPASPDSSHPDFREVCGTLGRNVSFRHLLLSFAVTSFFSAGVMQWLPSFFIRSHELDTGVLGSWFAAIYGLGGLLGTYLGGELASRYAANDEPLQLRAMALAYIAFGVLTAFIYLSRAAEMAFVFMALSAVGGAAATGPLFATMQTLIPQHMRAVSIAMVYLFANLIGMGLGPLVTGVMSDALRPRFGEESLRYASLALCPGYLWGAWHLWRASRTVARDVQASSRGGLLVERAHD